jgi:hypothetical protein
MATRELQMRWDPAVCEICQRSLLRGEYPVNYYDGDKVHAVCDLCTTRAQRQGWIREGTEVSALAPAAHAERARSLVARLRSRRDPSASTSTASVQPEAVESAAAGALELPHDDLPHHVQAVPTDAQAQASRALGLFNASEHVGTVSSVSRSLGAPYVHAAPGGDGVLVDVLVIWTLCWYRYEVDLENEAVRLRGQGYEPSELGAELPPANAIADERGRLSLASS